jgi:16S rRNA (uracil1498-N3)-methyltransferase
MLLRSRIALNNPQNQAFARRFATLRAGIGAQNAVFVERAMLYNPAKVSMTQSDFKSPRLFIDAPLTAGATLTLDRNQSNYLGNVLRLAAGDTVLVFNGREGEWRAEIGGRKRADLLVIQDQTRPQGPPNDLRLLFAPLKHARLDYMVQKAVEMGAGSLWPVMTRFTQVSRVNLERMRANVIEAAEQCGILNIAAVEEPVPLARYLADRDTTRLLIFCDEAAAASNPLVTLRQEQATGIDVLIGPEGGFSDEERTVLLGQPRLARISLGPRILRGDTAAVAALAVVQATLGDWGHFRPESC